MPDDTTLTADRLILAYAHGVFPMGDEKSGTVQWFAPDPRAHLPLDDFHIPHNLHRRVRRREFRVSTDRDFEAVIRNCADRPRTWITPRLIHLYIALHEQGHAHSVECWQDGDLAGGLYGVALQGAFFGESMFYRVSNASKVALVHLVRQLRAGGFKLLDTQYPNDHLEQFGVKEVPRTTFEEQLTLALEIDPPWWPLDDAEAADLNTPVSAFDSAPTPGAGNESGPNG